MTSENGRAGRIQPPSGAAAWRPTLRAEGRLGTRRLAALATPPVSRWESWTDRLGVRHRGVRGWWGRVGAVLARTRLIRRSTHPALRLPGSVTIRTALSIVRSAERPRPLVQAPSGSGPVSFAAAPGALRAQSTVERRTATTARPASGANTLLQRVLATEVTAHHRRPFVREQAVVERLVARRERRERPEATAPVPAMARPNPVLPAAGTLPAPAAVVLRPRTVSRPEPLPTPPRGGVAPLPVDISAPRPVTPVVDVEALADQVIRTIDRRVTAARERMGMP